MSKSISNKLEMIPSQTCGIERNKPIYSIGIPLNSKVHPKEFKNFCGATGNLKISCIFSYSDEKGLYCKYDHEKVKKYG